MVSTMGTGQAMQKWGARRQLADDKGRRAGRPCRTILICRDRSSSRTLHSFNRLSLSTFPLLHHRNRIAPVGETLRQRASAVEVALHNLQFSELPGFCWVTRLP